MRIPIETVRCEGFSMDFFRFGEGPRPLVILPGLSVQSVMLSADAVARAYASMRTDYTVFTFDRRKELPPVYPIADMAQDTAEAMRALGIGDADLFGASQGGMIAMEIALRWPELVRRLALGSTAADVRGARGDVLEKWIALADAGDAVGLTRAFGGAVYPKAVYDGAEALFEKAAGTVTGEELARFSVLAAGTRDFCVTDRLAEFRSPVLLLSSDDDRVLGPDAGREIAQALAGRPDFLEHRYTGFGHAAYDLAPDYRDRLLAFFRRDFAEAT
ncbi:MAG: alpha/beta fold hydrolase [Clostridia bacterium]|nr:alpha/beta fold hydrolase [Clostridia bacterium]